MVLISFGLVQMRVHRGHMAKVITQSLGSGLLSPPDEVLLARHIKNKKGGNEVIGFEAKSERFVVAKKAELFMKWSLSRDKN